MILRFNYLRKSTQPGLLGEAVSRFFRFTCGRVHIQPCGSAGCSSSGHVGIAPPPCHRRRPSTHPSSFILLMDIPAQTSASLPDCNPLNFNPLYI